MKKRKSNRIAALFASGVMFCGGIFASCSFLEPELSDYDKNALAVGIYLQQQEKLKAANASSSASGTTYETLTESRVSSTAPDTAGTITVSGAASYSGTSISEAWAAAAAVTSSGSTVLIEIPAGTYDLGTDQLAYKGSATIEIKGTGSNEYGSDVLIKTALENSKALNKSEQARSTISFQGSGNLILENLRIENTYAQTASGTAQLEIIGYDGSGYVAGYNCSFISGQDTMRTMGKAWFYHCYIEGDVDFLWMEYSNGGKVALYEDCRIRAISTRNSSARFTAPRVKASSTASYYKGLVIYNSKLEVEDGLKKVYLGRNIQYENNYDEYYENVSVVGCKLYGYLTDVWENKANSSSDIIFSGFNTDSYFPSNSNGSVYDSTTISDEFAGRNNILNRYYDGGEGKIVQADSLWDINSLASEKGWSVASDSSSSLLDGETVPTIYDFTTSDGNGYTETTCSGFALESGKTHAVGNDGSKISFKVDGNCFVYVTGYYSGSVTVQAGSQDSETTSVATGDTSTTATAKYLNYSGETTVTVTAVGTTYITQIKVVYLDEVVKITSITLSGASSVDIGEKITLSAAISPSDATYTSLSWTSSDTNLATVSDGVVNGIANGTVTITATARDGSGVYGTCDISVTGSFATSSTTVTWDLSSSSVNIQGTLGRLKGTVTGSKDYTVRALVDATVTSGKLAAVSGQAYAQMNSGTIIRVPVTAGATVSVTFGGNAGNCTIAGTSANKSTTYTHGSSAEAAWISIEATSSGATYPASIKITGLDVDNLPSAVAYDYLWSEANIVEDAVSFEKSKGYYDELYIDASNGKFVKNNTSWTQCNAGTVIYVPMNGAGTVSFTTNGAYTITGGASKDLSTTASAAVSYEVAESDLVSSGVDGDSVKYAKITFTTGGYIKNLKRTYNN